MTPHPPDQTIAQARKYIEDVWAVTPQALDALIAACLRRSGQPQELLTAFEARLRAKFTPALNTGSAMDALQLVGETIREMRADDHSASLAAGDNGPCCEAPREVRECIPTEMKYRRELWLNHGHSGAALYGDDGEMQCGACMPLSRLYDYKRAPLADVEAAAFKARMQQVGCASPVNERKEQEKK